MRFCTVLLLFCLILVPAASAVEPSISNNLLEISVTIKSGYTQGSGVLFTRDDRTFVWTAGHVVDNLRTTRTVVVNGDKKTVIEFKDAHIVQEFKQNGRRIGETKMDCRVVRYSDAKKGEDLALLEVRKRNFSTASVEFYSGDILDIGTDLIHVGSLHGQIGANSLTTGVLSQVGRVLDLGANGVVFDQVSTPGFPGSSGGGVFLQSNGECIGLLVRGSGETFCLIVPVRRIRAWADRANVAWALDASISLPTDAEFKKLPIEDTGTEFSSDDSAGTSSMKFPYMIQRDDYIWPNPLTVYTVE